MSDRIDAVRRLLREREADAVLLTFLPDVRWACGFTGSNGLLVVTPEAAHFVSDGRYRTQARREVRGAEIHIPGYDLIRYAAEERLLQSAGPQRRVLFQADHVPFAEYMRYRSLFEGADGETEWVPAENLLVHLVASKTSEEVARMRRAQQATDEVFDHLLGFVRPGQTEREIAAEIVFQHLRRGAERMSFDPIVAGGPNAALPHARPTDRPVGPGDVLLLDFGCVVDGYASDMTRTVVLGEPDEEVRRVYNLVRSAQERAIDTARSGLSTKTLDAAARDVIDAAGYGDAFSHGLGHGIGLQTHEWPRVSYHTDTPLPEGAAVTIEPGVYLPDRFGIRIEDVVVLHADGCENLTASPKELLVL